MVTNRKVKNRVLTALQKVSSTSVSLSLGVFVLQDLFYNFYFFLFLFIYWLQFFGYSGMFRISFNRQLISTASNFISSIWNSIGNSLEFVVAFGVYTFSALLDQAFKM